MMIRVAVISLHLSVALILGWLTGIFLKVPWSGDFLIFARAAALALVAVYAVDLMLALLFNRAPRSEVSERQPEKRRQPRSRGGRRQRRKPRTDQVPDASGKINSYKPDRSFGFITPDDGGQEVFFHANDIMREADAVEPAVGVAVEYKAEASERGPRAMVVRMLPEQSHDGEK